MAKSTPEFRRPHHRLVAQTLRALNAEFLAEAACFFGGGTQLAMSFGEYRESRDIDFLCSSRTGFKALREEVTEQSLGRMLDRRLELAREVRADRDGIRTFFIVDGIRLKFEILLEGRIDLAGAMDHAFGVPVLALEVALAEKFLANADRGLDDSTLSRDLVDLAFCAAHVGKGPLQAGLTIAEEAYGKAIRRHLDQALDAFRSNRARARACIDSLGIEDTPTLRKGLRTVRSLLA